MLQLTYNQHYILYKIAILIYTTMCYFQMKQSLIRMTSRFSVKARCKEQNTNAVIGEFSSLLDKVTVFTLASVANPVGIAVVQ